MDSTLQQILAALFQAHQTIDAMRARIAELEQAGDQGNDQEKEPG